MTSEGSDGIDAQPGAAGIERRLDECGIDVDEVRVVSRRDDRFEVVYEVTTEDGGTYFVQTLDAASVSRFRTLLETDLRLDFPITDVLDGTPPVLVMRAARGTPLSVVLPLYLTPGLWRVKRDDLRAGVSSLGRNLGRLHAATVSDRGAYGKSDVDKEKLASLHENLERLGFESEVRDRVERSLEVLSSTTVAHAMTHRDPSPHNVFYRGGSVELIDLDLAIRPAVIDVALAEIGLTLMARRLPYVTSKKGAVLTDALWRGYDATGLEFSRTSVVYRRVRVAQLCEVLLNYVRGEVYSLPGRVSATLDRRAIGQLVRADCAALPARSADG